MLRFSWTLARDRSGYLLSAESLATSGRDAVSVCLCRICVNTLTATLAASTWPSNQAVGRESIPCLLKTKAKSRRCHTAAPHRKDLITLSTSRISEASPQAKTQQDLSVKAVRCQHLVLVIFSIVSDSEDKDSRWLLAEDFNWNHSSTKYERLARFAAGALAWYGCKIGPAELKDIIGKIRTADPAQLSMWTEMPWEVAEHLAMPAPVRKVQMRNRGLRGAANLDRFLRLAAILEWLLTVPSAGDLASLREVLPSPGAVTHSEVLRALLAIDRAYARSAEGIE